jgi:predicted XRE-type DNA-binding protein
MKELHTAKEDATWEVGSHNVFADLDMPDANEKLAKVELARKINQLIKQKGLKQIHAAELLEVDQAKISLLNRGRLSAFSMERLVKYLNLLDQDVEIVIRRKKRRTGHGSLFVVFA